MSARNIARPGLQVPGRGDDPAVVIAGRSQAEPGEDARDVLLDPTGRDDVVVSDRGIGPALGDQREDFPFPLGEGCQRVGAAARGQQLTDHLRVEHCAAAGDPGDRVDEVADVRYPVLEQVADTSGSSGEELGCGARLDVLREDQDTDPRMIAANGPGDSPAE
jgi:hypothetical protein